MELHHIRYFLEVAETLNFSRAAERLHVSQPALSKQIRALEEELGAALFQRTTVKVRLTEAGEYFRQQTHKVLIQLDIAASGVQQMGIGNAGTLKLGCDWRTITVPVANAARIFRETNHRFSVQFIDVPTYEHPTAVRNRTVDLGFVSSLVLGGISDLELHRLCELKPIVILPKTHRLASRVRINLRDLADERWIALDAESMPGFRVLLAQLLKFTPRYGPTTASLFTLVANVVTGNGIAIMPKGSALSYAGDVVEVDTDCDPIEIFAIWARHGASPLIPAYIECLGKLIAGAVKKHG